MGAYYKCAKPYTEKYLLITDADTLASILTKDLREISQDGHVYVQHINNPKNSLNHDIDWKEKELENEKKSTSDLLKLKLAMAI